MQSGRGLAALKALVVGMGVLLVGGTGALIWIVAGRMNAAAEARAPLDVGLALPPGTRLVGVATTERGLAIGVSGAGGERVLLIDPRDGRALGEIRLGE